MIELSKDYCKEKHNGVFRKNNEPHYKHSIRVGEMVSKYNNDEDVIIAGYLHDILEHSNVTEKELTDVFNENVTGLIIELTNDSELIKIKGKFKYLVDKINSLSNDSLLIKLCDRYDNLTDSGSNPKYKVETNRLLKTLNRPLTSKHKEIIKLITSITEN